MFDYRQYKRGYFMPPVECNDWVKKEYIDKAPVWCSVDMSFAVHLLRRI